MIKSLLILIAVFVASILFVKVIAEEPEESWNPEWVEYEDSIDYKETVKSKSFSYVSGGIYLPIPLPTIGIGYRIKEKNKAFDLSVNLATVFIASSVESHIKGLHYYNKRDYFGGGTSFGFSYGGSYFDHAFISHISPLLTLGREYKDHIKELNVRFPTFTSDGVNWIPAISFKYGWKY